MPVTGADPTPIKTEARKLIHLGQPDRALEVLRGVLETFPTDWEAYALTGAALAQTGNEATSVPYFEQAVRLEPRRASNHYNLGVAYERIGNPAWAIEAYRHALMADPNFQQAVAAYYRLAPVWAPAHLTGAPPVQDDYAGRAAAVGR